MSDSSKPDIETADVVIGCLFWIITTPFSMLLRGFVLFKLWGWFIVPLGMVPISISWALGLAALVSVFNPNFKSKASIERDFGDDSVAGNVLY